MGYVFQFGEIAPMCLVLCFVMGYVFQFGEIAPKRVHYYCDDLFQVTGAAICA